MRLRIAVLVLLILSAQAALHATDVQGSVAGTWLLSGSPYRVTGDITIATGQTLNIDAGVHVLFAGRYRFTVRGMLQVNGTAEDSVVFTREDTTRWFGIRFINASAGCQMFYSVIEYVRKNDGNDEDANGGGIFCYNSVPTISHCTIRHNWASRGGGVLSFTPPSRPIYLDNCLITDNTTLTIGAGVWLQTSSTVTKCTITDNIGGNIYNEGISSYRNCLIAFGYGDTGSNSHYAFCDFFSTEYVGSTDPGFGELTMINANGDSCDAYGNIFLDPQFADTATGDYHLLPHSPCIDAGDPFYPPDADGTTTDIGVFSTLHGITLSPSHLNFGALDLGQDSVQYLTLNTTGSQPMPIVSVYHSPSSSFSVDTTGLHGVVLPDSDYFIPVRFSPPAVGLYQDTLLIVPEQGGSARAVLTGRGEVQLPPVEHLTLARSAGNSVELHWSPVTHTAHGSPFTPSYYIVYGSPIISGPYVAIEPTPTNSYTHHQVLSFQPQFYYYVTAAGDSVGRAAETNPIPSRP